MVELKKRGAGYEELHPLLEAGRAAIERIERLPYPVIAAVNGPAAGAGMNLALACDLRIASDKASFGETFARIGLHLDWAGSWTLPRLVGVGNAMELAWLAEIIDAAEALRLGLVHRVVPHEQFETEVKTFAERLARAPQTSVRHAKRNLRAAFDRTIHEALAAEIESQRACWDAADSAEGIRAFVEKRTAVFDGGPRADELSSAGRRFE
jgi:2-(1,2-epoxy-1,2-dihydrophenyl)acetyl-CoA isomerase